MQLEFHQLDRPCEHLRVYHPERHRRLLASLAESGQQTPIVVVADSERFLVIDGYKRLAALRQLGRDTVDAVVWPMSEADALILDRSLRLAEHETALEQGWLLAELERRFDYDLEALARRFDKSTSWISRRLALVELLPEAIQQQVREGKLAANLAMKYLVPVARVSLDDCERMSSAFIKLRSHTREAGQLYAAWRDGSPAIRKRILDAPELFIKTLRHAESKPVSTEAAALLRELETVTAILSRAGRRSQALPEMDHAQIEQARRNIERAGGQLEQLAQRIEKEQTQKHAEQSAAHHDSGTEHAESKSARDCEDPRNLAADGAQSSAIELVRRAGNTPERESRTPPPTDPGAFCELQRQSGSGP
jgi:ParB family chromosome partitioning protein